MQAPGLGPILGTAMRGLSLVTDKLTDVALPYAPADASPGVVRVTVSAGLVLLALSFVKSLLSVSTCVHVGARLDAGMECDGLLFWHTGRGGALGLLP